MLDKRMKIFIWIIFTCLIFSGFFAALTYRALAWEQVFRFLSILRRETVDVHLPARTYSMYIRQMLPLFAIWFGVKNAQLLAILFGIGIFVLPIIVIYIAILFFEKEKKDLAIILLLSYSISHFCNTYLSSTESTIAHSVFWLLFAILYSSKIYEHYRVFYVIPFLLLVTFKLYEGYAFFNIIFIILIIINTYRSNVIDINKWLIITPSLLVLFFGIFFPITGIVYYPFKECKINFFHSLITIYHNKIILFIVLVTTAMVFINHFISKVRYAIYIGLLLGLAMVIGLIYSNYFMRHIWAHHGARLMNFVVPLFFSSLILIYDGISIYFKRKIMLAKKFYIALIVVTFLNITNEIVISFKWYNFTKMLAYELKTQQGIVPVDKTKLPKLPFWMPFYMNSLMIAIAGVYKINPMKSTIFINDYYPNNPVHYKKDHKLEKYGIVLSYSDIKASFQN